jgi:hypothetical protein
MLVHNSLLHMIKTPSISMRDTIITVSRKHHYHNTATCHLIMNTHYQVVTLVVIIA